MEFKILTVITPLTGKDDNRNGCLRRGKQNSKELFTY